MNCFTSPANNASFKAPATITLAATAKDSDGKIAKLEFFEGANLLATVTVRPYTFIWTNVQPGSYTLFAKATDNRGLTTTSNAVNITVTSGAAQLFYIYTDQLNTPRVITDQTNKAVWRWDNNDPFGANVPDEDPNNTGTKFTFNPRFPGQYFDRETGLNYNYFRDYDPNIGRYVESDPVGLRGGLNSYTYVHSLPILLVDYGGLKDCVLRHRWLGPEYVETTRGMTMQDLFPVPLFNSADFTRCMLGIDLGKRSQLPSGPVGITSCTLQSISLLSSPVYLTLVTTLVYSTPYRQWVTEEWCTDGCPPQERFVGIVATGVSQLAEPKVVDIFRGLRLRSKDDFSSGFP